VSFFNGILAVGVYLMQAIAKCQHQS